MRKRSISKFKLHSIPIKHNKHLRYVSYSIPLISALALLLSGGEVYAMDSPSATASLSIASPSLSATVAPGETGYVSSNVTYSASDITNYTLRVTYANGYNSLKLNGGTATLAGAGTSGTTGSSLGDNTWGFAWGNTGDANANMKYYTVPSYGAMGTSMANGYLAGGSATGVVSTTKKLVFAAKFAGDNVNSGHYKTSVLLSLIATPKQVAEGFNGIQKMQDMTAGICNSAKIGQTGELEDIRDGSIYTVGKLSDGKCWMTQNLRLVDYTTKVEDSQTGGFTIPKSGTWTEINIDTRHMYYNGDADYGAYYNWYTATAGTGTEAVTGGDVSGSICPKGWRLPKGGSNGDFKVLADKYPTNYGSGLAWDVYNGKNGHWLGGANATAGGAFFMAAGYMSTAGGNLYEVGSHGRYWSGRASSDVDTYTLYFDNSKIGIANKNYKYIGLPVRCVAEMPEYTLKFDKNISDGTTTNVPESMSCTPTSSGSCTITLPSNVLENSCGASDFVGWSEEKLGRLPSNGSTPSIVESPGSSVTISGDTTLYAAWKLNGNISTCGSSSSSES